MESRSSSIPGTECTYSLSPYEDKSSAYKQLKVIVQIADYLDSEHVGKIVYLYDLPEKAKQQSPLDVLRHLHQRQG